MLALPACHATVVDVEWRPRERAVYDALVTRAR
jgi:hypothetical protein